MTDAQVIAAVIIVVPSAFLVALGMIRGYHMHLKIWKGSSKEEPGDDYHHDDR